MSDPLSKDEGQSLAVFLAILSALVWIAIVASYTWCTMERRHYRTIPPAVADSVAAFQKSQRCAPSDR